MNLIFLDLSDLSCDPFMGHDPYVGNHRLQSRYEWALKAVYHGCDSVQSVSYGDIWSCLCFDPLYPNNPNCCVSSASVPLGSNIACDATLTYTGRACWDTRWCPVLWLGHSTDLMFSDWISGDIPSWLKTLFKPSPRVKLCSVTAAFFPCVTVGTLGPSRYHYFGGGGGPQWVPSSVCQCTRKQPAL